MQFEKYLSFHDLYSRKMITQIRSDTSKLAIEKGRFHGIDRINRLCQNCTVNVIEDEYHFILTCPKYRTLGLKYLPNYYKRWPSIKKFMNLMTTGTRKTLPKLGLYIKHAFSARNNTA